MKSGTVILRALEVVAVPVLAMAVLAERDRVLDARQPVSSPDYVACARSNAAAQALDDELWWGQEFARRWKDTQVPPHEDRAGEEVARAILAALDDVPPPILEAIHDSGVRLVLHAGHVSLQPECADMRGDPEWDDTVGLHRQGSNMAFVQTDRELPLARHTLLHELAHAYEHRAGDIADREDFVAVYAADDAIADLGYPETVEEQKRPGEYFAESFADWFISSERRRWMRRERPAAAAYFAELQARLTELYYGRTERATNRALAQRRRERDERRPARELAGPRRRSAD